MTRLFIVGNDAFIVHAIRLALRYSTGVSVFGVIDGQRSVRRAVREAQPDVVVVDGLRDAQAGVDHLRDIRDEAPNALVLLLSAPLEHPALHEVLEAGAIAMSAASRVGAPAAVPAPALRERTAAALATPRPPVVTAAPAPRDAPPPAPAPRCPLTARELEILRAVAEGLTNARIGRQLWVTEQTVKFHLSNIYRKLGVSNRTEASRYALVHGLVALPDQATSPRGGDDAAIRRLVSQAG
jgi:DNA-binding NarL/FixJ family response regulator